MEWINAAISFLYLVVSLSLSLVLYIVVEEWRSKR